MSQHQTMMPAIGPTSRRVRGLRSARRLSATAALLAQLACAQPSWAGPSFICPAPTEKAERDAEARGLFDEALRLEAGEPKAAAARLECADGLVDRPAVALRLGVVSDRLQRDRKAIDAYQRYLSLAGEAAPDSRSIRRRIAELEKRAEDRERAAAAPTPAEAERSVPPARRAVGIVVAATGGALGIAGAALLLAANAESDELHSGAPGTVVWDSDDGRGRLDRAQLEQALGIGGLALGVTAIGVGLGLALAPSAADAPAAPPAASLRLAPGGLLMDVRFGPNFGL